jgi:hypothetical protein
LLFRFWILLLQRTYVCVCARVFICFVFARGNSHAGGEMRRARVHTKRRAHKHSPQYRQKPTPIEPTKGFADPPNHEGVFVCLFFFPEDWFLALGLSTGPLMITGPFTVPLDEQVLATVACALEDLTYLEFQGRIWPPFTSTSEASCAGLPIPTTNLRCLGGNVWMFWHFGIWGWWYFAKDFLTKAINTRDSEKFYRSGEGLHFEVLWNR